MQPERRQSASNKQSTKYTGGPLALPPWKPANQAQARPSLSALSLQELENQLQAALCPQGTHSRYVEPVNVVRLGEDCQVGPTPGYPASPGVRPYPYTGLPHPKVVSIGEMETSGIQSLLELSINKFRKLLIAPAEAKEGDWCVMQSRLLDDIRWNGPRVTGDRAMHWLPGNMKRKLYSPMSKILQHLPIAKEVKSDNQRGADLEEGDRFRMVDGLYNPGPNWRFRCEYTFRTNAKEGDKIEPVLLDMTCNPMDGVMVLLESKVTKIRPPEQDAFQKEAPAAIHTTAVPSMLKLICRITHSNMLQEGSSDISAPAAWLWGLPSLSSRQTSSAIGLSTLSWRSRDARTLHGP
ncbi:uncharacterized protein LTR77_010205 [Saxophila tyrrhenica]|uniref:Uncharacterized protein n=1 Tax=Saxophila tyrrhenica TaxID=1690608 RepID=A0AAV9NXV3_9PEZI|nr:hypothetical protein LTR77_010205 [Saxophila tyrrhenica]